MALAAPVSLGQQNPEDFIEEITEPDATPEPEVADPEPTPPPKEPDPDPSAAATEPDPVADPGPATPTTANPAAADPAAANPVAANPAAADPTKANPSGVGTQPERTKTKADPLTKDPPEDRVDAETAGSGLSAGVAVRQLSYRGLLERWDARRAAARGRTPDAKRQHTLFVEGLSELGLHGVERGIQASDLARALVMEARAAVARSEREEARELMGLALRASPDSPSVHLAAAETELKVGSLPLAIGHVVGATQASLRSPEHLVSMSARAAAALAFLLLVLLLVVAVLTVTKGFRLLVFDLWAALPRGAARWQVTTLLAIFLIIPIIAGAGPVFTALLWTSAGWLYLERREQIGVAVVGVAVLALPLVVGMGARMFSYPGSELSARWRAVTEIAADGERDAFRAKPVGDRVLAVEVALGEDAFREGRLEESLEHWRRVVQRAPDAAWAHNNLGVLAALQGKDGLASETFKDARTRDSGDLIPAFNTSLLSLRNPRKHKVNPDVQAMLDEGGPKLARLTEITFRPSNRAVSQNRAFIWAPMPHTVMADLWVLPPEAASSFEAELSKLLYLGLRPYAAMAGFGFFLLLWFVLSRLGTRLLPSKPCRRCGSPASSRYDGDKVPKGSCSACYHAFEATSGKVEAGGRLNKERQIASYQRRRSRTAILLSLIFSGAGHFYLGAPARGLAYAAGFGMAVTATLSIALDLLPWPSPQLADVGWLLWGPPSIVALILYAMSIRGASALSEN